MKVSLVTAPAVFWYGDADELGPMSTRQFLDPPLGVMTLAAILEEARHSVRIFDLDREFRDHWQSRNRESDFCLAAANRIVSYKADVICLGSICSTYPFTVRLCRELKRQASNVPLIVGGPQASVVDVASIREFPSIDYIVRGEADESLPRMIQCLGDTGDPRCVAGVTSRKGSTICRTPNGPPVVNLDAIPFPSYDHYGDVPSWPHAPLELGRGCPFACKFCSTNDFFRRKFRLKSPSRVVEHMNYVRSRYGIQRFDLIHDMFTVDRRKVVEFCLEMIRNGRGMEWNCSARTDFVDHELLSMMADAGCSGLFFGIETGSPRMQKVIDKGLDLDEARKILDTSDRLKIRTTVSLIMGYPDETKEDFRQTVDFFGFAVRADHSEPQLHRLAPLAETPLTVQYKDRLTLDGYYSDLSHVGSAHYQADRELITRHPEIFPNFYAVPGELGGEYLQETRAFLLSSFNRCKGLLSALHLESGDLLAFVDEWLAWRKAPLCSVTYYSGTGFLRDLLAYTAESAARRGWVATTVMTYYYSRLIEASDAPKLEKRDCALPGSETESENNCIAILAEGLVLIRVAGDVVRVLACLRDGVVPAPDVLSREVSLLVRRSVGDRAEVIELPPFPAFLLQQCDGSSTLGLILERAISNTKMPLEMCSERMSRYAFELLRQKGYVELVTRVAGTATRSMALST